MIRRIDNEHDWADFLKRIGRHDFYHTFSYHELEARRLDAQPVMYVSETLGFGIALPLLVRPVPHYSYFDATSVYGYAGPLYWGEVSENASKIIADELSYEMYNDGIVSVFSRLHPLLDNAMVISQLGEITEAGKTVAIDLRGEEQEQFRQYRGNHRSGIKKLVKLGYNCHLSKAKGDFLEFVDIYEETMQRVEAREMYFFTPDYMAALVEASDYDMQLVVCTQDDDVAAAGLFSFQGPFAGYHLGGTRNTHLKNAPMKLLFDFVRRTAAERGLEQFHLGGGLSGQEDSLFNFKRGFSNQVLPFKLWKWIVNPQLYDDLCAREGKVASDRSFFPAYRQ